MATRNMNARNAKAAPARRGRQVEEAPVRGRKAAQEKRERIEVFTTPEQEQALQDLVDWGQANGLYDDTPQPPRSEE